MTAAGDGASPFTLFKLADVRNMLRMIDIIRAAFTLLPGTSPMQKITFEPM